MNFKKLLASIGLLAVAAPATLSVAACGTNRLPSTDLEQEIVNEINGNTYQIENLPIKSSVEDVNKIISGDFIKEGLSDEVANAFNANLFKFNKITVNGIDLKSEDLVTTTTIEAKINYDYGKIVGQETDLIISLYVSDQQIVEAINSITGLKIEETTNSNLDDVINRLLKSSLIENHIEDEVIRASFSQEKFKLSAVKKDDGSDFTEEDLKTAGNYQLEIHYNYASINDQKFDLLAKIVQGKNILSNVFEHFSFSDSKNVKDFLDNNKLDNITQQIQEFLDLDSLKDAGLVLDKKTSNSIVLKANEDSQYYKGEVALTWNLKLLEIYGNRTQVSEEAAGDGLRGYLYISKNTNKIEYVIYPRMYGYIHIHYSFNDYHKFIFTNKNNYSKEFVIQGRWLSDQVASKFGTFDFEDNTEINITSPELQRVKVFNHKKNTWDGLEQEKTFIINQLGQLTEK